MTVKYGRNVTTVGVFWKLTFTRWRGSLVKLLKQDIILYFILYYLVRILYKQALQEQQKRYFEDLALYFHERLDKVHLAFVLGFYVPYIYRRWWAQALALPCPDRVALDVAVYVRGSDERGREIRRTIMRYINLSMILCLVAMCSRVKKRFPTIAHLVKSGIMNEEEQQIIEGVQTTEDSKYWIPITWASSLVELARKEQRTIATNEQSQMQANIQHFKSKLKELLTYDHVSFPLIYTQVVTIGVYFYLALSVIARQHLDLPKDHHKYYFYKSDFVFPYFALLELIFYMGWLRAAEVMINPFGEDDEDFEMNTLIDRNIRVSYHIVDTLPLKQPVLVKDAFWNKDPALPYTNAAREVHEESKEMTTDSITLNSSDAEFTRDVDSADVKEKHEHCGRLRRWYNRRISRFAERCMPKNSSYDFEGHPEFKLTSQKYMPTASQNEPTYPPPPPPHKSVIMPQQRNH